MIAVGFFMSLAEHYFQTGVLNSETATKMNNYEAQTCDNCGAELNCYGDLNCECADLKIPEYVQDFIGVTFDRCLCRKCILKLIAEMGD